jgi:hypothetical protein
MFIYKITNLANNKWYIGKHNGKDPNYMGSGKLLKRAIQKHGIENFKKEILEECENLQQLNDREKHWIAQTNATTDPLSYNLASGGEGGDLSKFVDQATASISRSKGWFVSKVDDPTEVFVHSISKWCEQHGIDKSIPTMLNDPKNRLFQKQTKGWRIRRSDMPELPPYIDKRTIGHKNIACKGKTWKLVNGKRVWQTKYIIE